MILVRYDDAWNVLNTRILVDVVVVVVAGGNGMTSSSCCWFDIIYFLMELVFVPPPRWPPSFRWQSISR